MGEGEREREEGTEREEKRLIVFHRRQGKDGGPGATAVSGYSPPVLIAEDFFT